MSEKATARSTSEKAPSRARSAGRNPSSAPSPATAPLSGLQQNLGNQAMLQLLEAGVLQAKLRVSQPGDADEIEADRIADQIVSRQHAPVLQRKCACDGGGTPCAKCAGEDEEKIHRSATGPKLRSSESVIQRSPADASATPAQTAAGAQAEAPADRSKPPAQILVDDEAKTVAPHQMRKSQFIALLRAEACATADAVLMSVGHTTKSCPYIEKWLGFYEKASSQHIEQALHKYAPETAGARNAHEAIRMAVKRVQRAAFTWAKTGKIEGMPKELAGKEQAHDASPESSSASSGGFLGFLSGQKKKDDSSTSVMRKARNGEHAPAQDAASVKSNLGSGHSLDSRVQSQMSSAFGHDFSGVRVHTDSRADSLSSDLQARAFAIGNDVAFAAGEYKPGTLIGDALIAHELAHVVQQGGVGFSPTVSRWSADPAILEADANRSTLRTVSSLLGRATDVVGWTTATAIPLVRSGLRLQRCSKSEREKEREKEIERLGALQYGFMDEKRKAEEAKLRKEAEEEAKKKGLPPPASGPKVEMGDVIKEEEGKYALKGSPTAEWDNADQPAWKKRADDAWTAVVASVKGTELESVVRGVKPNFDPKRALEGGFYAQQDGHTLNFGMSWVKFAEKDPKNVWENLAHEMAGHLTYGKTYGTEIMDSALSKLSPEDRKRFREPEQKFFETYEYPETEIYASLWQRRYRVPEVGAAPESGGIHPDENITDKLKVMLNVLQPEVAKAVLNELKRRVFANDQILARDKKFFLDKVKEVFKYNL